MATDACSYAIGSAIAVWVTVLLIRSLRTPSSHRLWVGYALAAGAAVYVVLYLGRLLVVQGLFVAMLHRRALARWGTAALASVLLAVPIILIAYRQRHQHAFLARRKHVPLPHILTSQWFGWN